MKHIVFAAVLAASFASFAEVVVVNPDFERGEGPEVVGWQTSSKNFSVVAGAGLNGNRGLVWHRAEKGGHDGISQAVTGWKPGERYTVVVKARTQNFTSQNWWGACVGLEAQDKDGKFLSAAYGRFTGPNRPFTKLTATTKPIPENAARLVVQLFVGGNNHKNLSGTVTWDEVMITRVEVKPVLFMHASAYRNEATSGKVRFGVSLDVPLAQKGKVKGVFAWRDAEGNVQKRPAETLTDTEAIASLDVGPFAFGTTQVGFRLYADDGKTLGETSLAFTRPRTKTPRRVEIDADDRCLVDGQPFFPIGLYFGRPTKPELDVYRQGPFNCLMPYACVTSNDLNCVHAAGLKTFVSFQAVFKNSKNGIKYGYTTDEKVDQFYVNRVHGFKNHPAVLGWYLFDEPAADILPELKRIYGLLCAEDPDHPIWGVHHVIDEVRPRVPLCDVIGVDPYPVSTQYPIRQVADFAEQTQAAQFGSGPMWNVPQVIDWIWYRKDLPETHFPTEAELKAMLWQNVVRGAKGLIGYSFAPMRKHENFEANWRTTCAAFGEVASVTNILLSVEKPPVIRTPETNLAVRAWAKDGMAYVLACNLNDKPLTACVTFADGDWQIVETLVGAPGKSVDARTLSFDLPAIGYSMVRLERAAESKAVFQPTALTGEAVQQAIDRAASAGGGCVVLKAGTYPSGTLYLKSHVELRLEKGAVLLGSDKWSDYDDVDDPRILKQPERSKKAFIAAICCEDVAITGEGTIDGQGVAFYDSNVPPGRMFKKPAHPRTRMLQFFCCRGVRLSGVLLKDSPGWTCWMRRCENVDVSRLRIVGDPRMINNDGLHFDGCSRVRVADSTFRTGDDCLIVRANPDVRGNASLSEDVRVTNCAFDSSCQGVRIGCPSDGTVRNVRISNCTFRGMNGILSYNPLRYLQEGNRGRLALADIRFEKCEIDVRGCPLTFAVDPGITLKDFGHVTIADSRLKGKRPVRLEGTAETPLVDVRLENCTIEIDETNPMSIRHVVGLVQKNVTVKSGPGESTPFTWNWKSDSWECDVIR